MRIVTGRPNNGNFREAVETQESHRVWSCRQYGGATPGFKISHHANLLVRFFDARYQSDYVPRVNAIRTNNQAV
jgi:hypothetical protein